MNLAMLSGLTPLGPVLGTPTRDALWIERCMITADRIPARAILAVLGNGVFARTNGTVCNSNIDVEACDEKDNDAMRGDSDVGDRNYSGY